MILKEETPDNFIVAKSKIDYGDIRKGGNVFVYKTIPGLKDLSVHKAVQGDENKVHYFFNHELEF
ncbi:hypothetical protein AG74_83 [Vibrio phage AG74]|uniref:Uncharacterized protein n=4 Tax=Thalassavirus TaxID=2948922 RepID=A0A4Y6EIQ4_9CAUD|nr:hypothetical protein KNU52_gp081 [Vibrio phage Achelous]YP_010102515.1 hypothetical protein KNU58_gp075 [Vibrio phage Brizo]YP_010108128.1 hypothetical protein KNV06_gp083 [Vibrio phage AG74]YP_010114258.1 hypothetical protein KNV71_gp088 [Vibrio phage Gary]QQO89722.1 hypothetical protein GRLPWR_87 [Vibrio phage GRLPWR]WBF69453.1 hypothetical protein IW18_82 [Vibrio phage IW18]QCQ57678.1 hypothetical protein ACHELOUS_81 [Vibrio phage Achelous]QDF14493.1 hypothetical protein BRIZO_74 [Vibr